MYGQPVPQYPVQYQQPISQQVPAAQPLKKIRGTKKPWNPEDVKKMLVAMADTSKRIGHSFTSPKSPEQVPADAPDGNEWSHLGKQFLALAPIYNELFEKRSKLKSTVKGHNGGLEQPIYLRRDVVNWINSTGILNKTIPVDTLDAEGKVISTEMRTFNLRIPTVAEYGGIGVTTRALLTSMIVALAEERGLKHPQEKKYIALDPQIMALIGEANFKILEASKPKEKKKKAVDPNKPVKPKKDQPRVKSLDRNGQQIPHFSFDAIPAVCSFLLIHLTPIEVTPDQRQSIAELRAYLKHLTAGRTKIRKEVAKKDREAKKASKVQESIVPTHVVTLTLNPQFQLAAQPAQPGAQGFQGFVPAPTQPVPFQPAQPVQNATPGGFVPVPGVSFVQGAPAY